MKTILIVDHRNFGMASRSIKEAYSLSKQYQVIWIGLNNEKVSVKSNPKSSLNLIKLSNYFSNRLHSKLLGVILLNLRLFFLIIGMKYDKVIVHDLKVWVVVVLSIIKRKKIIYDAHEIHYIKRDVNKFRNIILNKIDYLVEHIFLSSFSGIIQTNIKRAELFSLIHQVKMPVVIENYDNSHTIEAKDYLRKSLGLTHKSKIIIMSGYISIGWIWRPEVVIMALPFLSEEIVFCMMGFINDDVKLELQRVASSLSVDHRVYFHKSVPTDKVVTYLSSADIAVIPLKSLESNSEFPSPNKLYQAVSAHLPVVYTSNEFLDEIILNNKVGPFGVHFDINETADLVDAIKNALNDSNILKSNAIRIAKESYNWDIQVQKLFNLIEEL